MEKEKRLKTINHLNIGELSRGKASKMIHELVDEDKTAFVQKNGKPIAVIISYRRYERMIDKGIDINEF